MRLFFSVILQVEDTDINGSFPYLGFSWGMVKTFMPPNSPQIEETQFPILQRSMGNELS